jgi:hypothetical protein
MGFRMELEKILHKSWDVHAAPDVIRQDVLDIAIDRNAALAAGHTGPEETFIRAKECGKGNFKPEVIIDNTESIWCWRPFQKSYTGAEGGR